MQHKSASTIPALPDNFSDGCKLILNSLKEAVLLTDETGRLIWLNHSAVRCFPGEIIGCPLMNAVPCEYVETDATAPNPSTTPNYGGVLRGEEILRRQVRVEGQHGLDYFFELDAQPIPHQLPAHIAMMVVLRDMSTARRLMQSSSYTDIEFHTIFETSLDAMAIYRDMPPTHYMVNDAYLQLFGYDHKDEIEGTPSLSLIAPDSRGQVRESIIERIHSKGGPANYVTRGRRRDGTEFDLEVHAWTYHTRGHLLRMSILRDISVQIEAQKALSESNRTLETRVEERTAELARAHMDLQHEAIGRRELEAEMRMLSEREQSRIGNDLHDGLGQELTAIGFMLSALRNKSGAVAESALDQVDAITGLISAAVTHTRQIASGLSPLDIDGKGLYYALERLGRNLEEIYSIRCTVDCSCEKIDGSPLEHEQHKLSNREDVEVQIFRIVQEATTNAVRHADATTIDIRLHQHGMFHLLEIEDNGTGISDDALSRGDGFGMRTMQNRAKLIDGTLTVARGESGGTIVRCEFQARPTDTPASASPE